MEKLNIAHALLTYFGFLVALTMHEAAHAIAARALGDKSLNTEARATINPIPHMDLFGTVIFPVMMLLSGIPFLFGWAKPVHWDSRSFKRIKRDINLVSLAGPGMNFLIAVTAGLALKYLGGADPLLIGMIGNSPAAALLQSIAIANLVIGIFNLIPFPNSDGWRILINNLHYSQAQKLEQYAMPINIIMMVLLLFGAFGFIFTPILGIFFTIFS